MQHSTALIITSISAPNKVLTAYSKNCREHGIDFIVVGDVKSPPDFQLNNCDFWSIKKQRKSSFNLARILPEKHYARKNLGYLIAIERGAETIIETDDDNTPLNAFWQDRNAEQSLSVIIQQGWINVYRHFTDEGIWPRGFPLEFVQNSHLDTKGAISTVYCPIQQGLANGDPDVDAVYRLIMPLPVSFRNDTPIALGIGCWSPFNSQNTTWFKAAFPLLYIPSFCSFRMCDIWRSFVATRICWENNWNIMFHGPTVYQERNEHDLIRDFQDEIAGYLNNKQLCLQLAELKLKGGVEFLGDDLRSCYKLLIEMGYVGTGESSLIEAWLKDIATLT